MHMHHTKSTPVRIVPHQQSFVEFAIVCSLCCSYYQTLQKLTLGLHVLHGKNGPKAPITTMSCKVPFLWVVLGQLLEGSINELTAL